MARKRRKRRTTPRRRRGGAPLGGWLVVASLTLAVVLVTLLLLAPEPGGWKLMWAWRHKPLLYATVAVAAGWAACTGASLWLPGRHRVAGLAVALGTALLLVTALPERVEAVAAALRWLWRD